MSLSRRNKKLVAEHGGGKIVKFKDLPFEYQAAVAVYSDIARPKELSDPETMTDVIEWVGPNTKFGMITLPISALTKAILKDEEIAVSAPSFPEYHAWYVSGKMPKKYATLWPVILSQFNEETLEDGWHRFHAYYRDGVRKIPAMWYIGIPKGITETRLVGGSAW